MASRAKLSFGLGVNPIAGTKKSKMCPKFNVWINAFSASVRFLVFGVPQPPSLQE